MIPLPEKRHSIILSEIEVHKFVSIAQLGERLSVSRETIRSDIAQLAKQNLLQQVRGGATRVEKTEAAMSERENINLAGKQKIASIVAGIIPDGASLIIDSGSTTLTAARALAAKSGLIIYTNDVSVALAMVASAAEVHLLGGKLGHSEHSTHGADTLEMLSNYRADYALIGVGGLSGKHGFTDYNRDVAKMRDAMIEAAATPIFVGSHEKFGNTASVKLKNANQASYLATDSQPDKELSDYLETLHLDILTPH